MSIQGCGKVKEDSSANSSTSPAGQLKDTSNPENTGNHEDTLPENTKTANTKTANTPETSSAKISGNKKTARTAEPEVKTARLSASQQYSDTNRTIKVLGLKEYKKLKSDKYTDKPSNGNKFLVLFLSIKNDSSEDDYINYNYISAKIDGKDTEHTAVFNAPEKYPTVFDTIKAGKTAAGFIVWEVPSGWSKLELTYNGWKYINNISLEAEFTPEDLSDPVVYNSKDYN